jgi:hypothetical protein
MFYVLGLMNVFDRIKIENPPATAKGLSGILFGKSATEYLFWFLLVIFLK